MKKKILKATLVAAFALVAGYNVYSAQKSDTISSLVLENVEALAESSESSGYGTLYGNASGTRYCCCPGSSRTCGASSCLGC